MKKYHGTARIIYDVEVFALSAADAEMEIMERLSDDIAKGIIRMDLFDNGEDGPDYRFPMLMPVIMEELENEA